MFHRQGRQVRKRQARKGEGWWDGAVGPGWRRGGFGMPARGVLQAQLQPAGTHFCNA